MLLVCGITDLMINDTMAEEMKRRLDDYREKIRKEALEEAARAPKKP